MCEHFRYMISVMVLSHVANPAVGMAADYSREDHLLESANEVS